MYYKRYILSLRCWLTDIEKDRETVKQTSNNFPEFPFLKNIVYKHFLSMSKILHCDVPVTFFEVLNLFFQTLYCALHTNDFIFQGLALFLQSEEQIKFSINQFYLSKSFVLGLFSFFGCILKSVIKTNPNHTNYKTWNLPLFVILLRFTFLFPVFCIMN